MTGPGPHAWRLGHLADLLLQSTPHLGGLWLRARVSPARTTFVDRLTDAQDWTILTPYMADEDLLGGMDVAATLATGRLVERPGCLARAERILLHQAERATAPFLARLAAEMDRRPDLVVVAIDEGAEEEERLGPILRDRLALHLDLTDVSLADSQAAAPMMPVPAAPAPVFQIQDAVEICTTLGVTATRADLHMLRTVRGLQSMGLDADQALQDAAALVLAHRGVCFPPGTEDAPQENVEPESQSSTIPKPLEDKIVEAVKAVLPEDVLDHLSRANRPQSAAQSGQGQVTDGGTNGRPSRPLQRPARRGERIDILATLRAAAPYQTLRKVQAPGRGLIQLRASDLRAKRYVKQAARCIVFAVDASGSAASARLAEAKGAIELLLARAYSNRDAIAMVSFAGETADLMLPPTRSLTRAKRELSGLPGGGATPLANGLRLSFEIAQAEIRRGRTAQVAVLTDGKANISLNGERDRSLARADCHQIGRSFLDKQIGVLCLDTGKRPNAEFQHLSQIMGARYEPLPRATNQNLARVIDDALIGS